MKVGVVGGTGTLSLSLVRLLLARGHEVVCFNRGITPGLPTGARLIRGDRTEAESFERVMQAERFDAAVDMICFNPEQARSDLRAFRGVRQFLFCSTAAVYGLPLDHLPATEDHPRRPVGPYGRNKAEAEDVFLEAFRRETFPVTIVRPSTTYAERSGLIRQIGARQEWLDRIRKGKPILVCGEGTPLHQFLHADDAAILFTAILEGGGAAAGEIFNAVGPSSVAWRDYHQLVMRALGREVEQVSIPFFMLRDGVPRRFGTMGIYNVWFSGEKAQRAFREFRPRIRLDEGLRRAVEVLQKEGRIPDCERDPWEDQAIEILKSAGDSVRRLYSDFRSSA